MSSDTIESSAWTGEQICELNMEFVKPLCGNMHPLAPHLLLHKFTLIAQQSMTMLEPLCLEQACFSGVLLAADICKSP